MVSLTTSPEWLALKAHHARMSHIHMRELFAQDAQRFERYSLRHDTMLVDYSKNLITDETLALLFALARARGVEEWRDRMFRGDRINVTENRAVLHTALRNRSDRPVVVDGRDVMPDVRGVLDHMRLIQRRSTGRHTGRDIRAEAITDVVNIGIGGSDLGPVMVTEALRPYGHPDLRCISCRMWTGRISPKH